MKPLVLLPLLVVLSQSATNPSPREGFYLGALTRGGQQLEVGVALTADKGAVAGEYFYFGRSHQPIALRGTSAANQALRLEESLDGGQVTGRWALAVDGSRLTGTWTSAANGRQWAVQLTRADQASSYFAGPARTLETGLGPLAFRVARVPASDHRVPLITSFKERRALAAVNAMLMAEANASHCDDRASDDFEFEADAPVVVADLLSVRITVSWFCGAAYPTTGADQSLVFDLRNTQRLTFRDLFAATVPKDQLVAVLFPYELSRARAGKTGPSSQDDQSECLEHWSPKALVDESIDQSFHLTAEGIVVRLDLPHVIAACANDVTVPYKATASLAAANGPLARLAAARAGDALRYRIHRPGTAPETDVYFTPR